MTLPTTPTTTTLTAPPIRAPRRGGIRLRSLIGAAAASILVVGVAQPVNAAPSQQDRAWMTFAHQSNLAEIAAGQSAQANATSAEVKQLAEMFIEMHTALDADLTAAAASLGVTLPATPTPEQQQQLAAVEANDGPAYDTAWIAQQLVAHEVSLQAGSVEISTGTDPTVVGLAQAAAPVIQQHLTELQGLSAGAPTRIETGSGGNAAESTSSSSSSSGMLLIVVGIALVAGSGALVWSNRRHAR